ncbi:MAG: energy transducer TonB [Chitinophagaceae bacterium]
MKNFYFITLLQIAIVLSLHAQSNSKDSIYMHVDTAADFPGGQPAWMLYLMKNLVYPAKAMNTRITGNVLLQFVVDEKGRVKKVNALSGPVILQKEGIRLLQSSPRWVPAIKNGEKVSSYRNQHVSFRLES